MLLAYKNKVQDIFNTELIPSYVFFRQYYTDSELKIHRDRSVCEFSATILIDKDGDQPTSLCFCDDEHGSNPVEVFMEEGDAIMFYGTTEFDGRWHYRPKVEQKSITQAFLHYVSPGNVAQYAIEKATQLGGKVVTASDSSGYIYDADGITPEKLAYIMEIKNVNYGRIGDYVTKYPSAKFVSGKRPWEVKCDIALPCATQNELNGDEAKALIANGCTCVAEGANMPSTPEAVTEFLKAKILFAPGKASNAGGVATSGLEMSQNSLRLSWTSEEVDQRLKNIMANIHEACVKYGTDANGYTDYVKGANIAGFVKVADAMLAQGIV
jgi:hypothetical protein